MREQLDNWCLYKEAEDNEQRLCRFFIALDELRARLSSRYPNLEISDEGYRWFNIDTTKGTVEILAFPFGFKNLKQPSIAVSLPRKARETHSNLLKKLQQIAKSISEAETFTGTSPRDETLKAYSQNNQPPITLSWKVNILETRKEDIFSNYLGIGFPVVEKTVSGVEQAIRGILLKLGAKPVLDNQS